MEDEIIKIRCQNCGSILSVKYCNNIEDKYVTCPICKQKARFNSYGTIVQSRDNDEESLVDSIMYRFTEYEKDHYKDSIKGNYSQYCIENPCSISVITLNKNNEFHIIAEREGNQSLKFSKSEIENIRHRIKELTNIWELQETYYLCPLCGNVMNVKSWPREFGDDYVCECPCCGNGFKFGGTRFASNEGKQINEISANPMILARNVFINKTKMIAQTLQSKVFLIDNYRLIMKAYDNGWVVTHIIQMYS